MDITTHLARITTPISYRGSSGRLLYIPVGPCLVESDGGQAIDVIWGARGQNTIDLPREEIMAARDQGHLVLLD